MGFILGLIGNIILGAIVGYAARAVLPGAQDIGLAQTIAVGVIASLIGFFVFSWFWLPITFVITVLLAAAGISIGIKPVSYTHLTLPTTPYV